MARPRDYAAEYRRRQDRARERGFSGYWEQRKTPRHPAASKYGRIPPAARELRNNVLAVIALARQERISIEEAAGRRGVPMSVVRWWAPEAIGDRRDGKTYATRADRLLRLRPLFVEGESEVVFVATRGSVQARWAERAFRTQVRFLAGDAGEDELARLQGRRVAGRVVETDPARLAQIGRIGDVDPGVVYRELF